MKNKNREYFKDKILERLIRDKGLFKVEFHKNNIKSFVVDDLLPIEDVNEIYASFPLAKDMKLKKTLREYKLIDAQLDKHNQILEEITYAFHHDDILKIITEITGIQELIADDMLYAGGLSRMEKNQSLNPHLDNSHDNDRKLYRVLNLLFYVTPNREENHGGNLELWDNGLKNKQRTIYSKFNRLAIMITNKESWHSVSKVLEGDRCCVSNYYFSKKPLTADSYFHVTTFKGFPNQPFRNLLLTVDSQARMAIRKIFTRGIKQNTHVYKKEK